MRRGGEGGAVGGGPGRPRGRRGPPGGSPRGPDAKPGAAGYVVWVQADDGALEPRRIRVGITDLDDTEVLAGLDEGERVVLLPSPDLVRFQQQRQQRIDRMMGGVPGMNRR